MTDRKQDNQRMIELARKWQDGSITEAEKREFDRWFASFDDVDAAGGDEGTVQLGETIYGRILEETRLRQAQVRVLWKRWTVAAAVLLLIAGGWFFMTRVGRSAPAVAAVSKPAGGTMIVPGSNRAILTLGNGSRLILDSAKDGLLAQQGKTVVMKEGSGVVSYAGNNGKDVEVLYNTISTPRGGQYEVTLPDGSKVWLNAASSIRFPTAFVGTSRDVEVSGEAYFEIAADKAKPFRVAVAYPNGKMMDVEVLGTQFNIMAYEEENIIKTTLLEGAVRVSHHSEGKVLRPGQQAQLRPGGALHTLDDADTEAAVAWRNGQTVFAGEDIQTIMRKVSRWYDVDVEYKGQLSQRSFTGGISRRSDLSALLKILELNQIHYKVEGKKIILMP